MGYNFNRSSNSNNDSHLKLSENESRKIMVLPENSDEFDSEISWGMFGLNNLQSTNLFISRDDILRLYSDFDEDNGMSKILNQLLVFPSGNIQEITDIKWEEPGQNNLYVYQNQKSVYKLVTKAYSNSKQNDIDEEPLEVVTDSMDDLDDYFASLSETQDEIIADSEEISNTDSVFGRLG